MDILRAKELLTALADGVNPLTGELLSQDDSCNQAEIVRALYSVLAELDKAPKKPTKVLPANAGKPWTEEDAQRLCSMFDAGSSQKQMRDYFKRTNGSLAAKLVALGKLQYRDEYHANVKAD